ncbi:sodium/potassium/calcium exchanger 4-like [Harmonia axyridis]|uniref:sodium/potassium/calcium exchanger 4-like n=1 Tax=Harmonia axyridis TaxID=115357 RepID=UPI001E27939A|nr:sodium/potassium/calcium exchanger 4-like [Harmonia axyridis]
MEMNAFLKLSLCVFIFYSVDCGRVIQQGVINYNSFSPSVLLNSSSTNITESRHLLLEEEKKDQATKDPKPSEEFNDIGKSPLITILDNLTCPDSSEDFPHIFSAEELRTWAIIPVILVGIYCFTILAIICDKYFLPCMEVLCEVFNLPQDVAAATFMSIATSTPELFVNIIGTFITKSDLGVGTIVGSSLFNALGVAAIGSLAASQPIQLDWWPLTRDVIIYICAVFLLVLITWDGYIYWYEGLILFVVYFLYFTVMYNNTRISNFISKFLPKRKVRTSDCDEAKIKNDQDSLRDSVSGRKISTASPYGSYMEDSHHRHSQQNFKNTQPTISVIQIKDHEKGMATIEEKNEDKKTEEEELPWYTFPKDANTSAKCLWIYLFPIKCFLHILLPDPRKHPNLYPLIFLMCIVSIGVNSYVVSWMITLIGSTFRIPDAVLGFTFLAAGGCLPESISITIMSRRGEGSMGVSNSLGANTMNILMSLGLPWFLKTIMLGTNENSFIKIESGTIEYTIVALIGVAVILFVTLYLNKFQLRKRVGVILCVVYLVCISLAIVSELLTRQHC